MTDTHIEVLPPSVQALRGIIFYTVAKINQKLSLNITNKFFHFLAYLLLLIIMNIVSAIKFNNSCI